MTKVVKKAIKTHRVSVGSKVARDANTGTFVTFRTVDAESKSFTNELNTAFKKNVAAALRRKKIASRVRAVEKPKLWIVAGPNGSGKTTLYGRTDIEDFGRSVWIINPDLLTAQIAAKERLTQRKANIETLNRINRWLHASVRAYKTIGVETVLSTPKYRPLVRQAKKLGFEIRLL